MVSYLTAEGLSSLKEELERLKGPELTTSFSASARGHSMWAISLETLTISAQGRTGLY
jgi:hypothetical protein